MDASSTNDFKLQEILLDKNLAKFGDAIVNYIYNAAVYEATEKLQGVKVWDKSLAKACRASPLRNLVGSKKNAGELGDAVEAFIGFLYIKKSKSIINQMIEILKRFIIQNWVLLSDEQEICSDAFTHLLSVLCNEIGIV